MADSVLPGLYISNFSIARKKSALEALGVTHILNCTNELPLFHDGSFHYANVKLVDNTDRNILATLPRCIRWINDALAADGVVLVHCAQGSSRSGSMIVGFLMHSLQLPYTEALKLAQTKRWQILPNPGFAEQLEFFGQAQWALEHLSPEQQQYLASLGPAAEFVESRKR